MSQYLKENFQRYHILRNSTGHQSATATVFTTPIDMRAALMANSILPPIGEEAIVDDERFEEVFIEKIESALQNENVIGVPFMSYVEYENKMHRMRSMTEEEFNSGKKLLLHALMFHLPLGKVTYMCADVDKGKEFTREWKAEEIETDTFNEMYDKFMKMKFKDITS